MIFAKRSISLTKIYFILGSFFVAFGAFVASAILFFAPGSSSILISAGFSGFGVLFFATPLILLYVYDKNNGVLEYLLSLGWSQSDIFKRYLKASLFLASVAYVAEFIIIIIVSLIAGPTAIISGLLILAVIAGLGFSAVSLVTIAMMAFSSLQKQRVGANSPLALAIGVVIILPTFYVELFLPFGFGILFDLLVAGLAGILSVVLLTLSGRLIRREKMLP